MAKCSEFFKDLYKDGYKFAGVLSMVGGLLGPILIKVECLNDKVRWLRNLALPPLFILVPLACISRWRISNRYREQDEETLEKLRKEYL